MFRGALHAHSTYSDGELTLAELCDLYEQLGCRFLFVSDHADAFTPESIDAYVRECAELSSERFLVVPSLEYSCDQRLHILGYGTTRLASTTDPEAVIRHIRESDGIPVIAHPRDAAFDWIERFAELPHGIEVWNSKYDGRYAPRPQTFRLLQRLRERSPAMLAFYGQDLHWRRQPRLIFVDVDAPSLSPGALIAALRDGRYHGIKGDMRLPPNGVLSDEILTRFGVAYARATRVKRFLVTIRDWAGLVGARVPDPVKARLRRFF